MLCSDLVMTRLIIHLKGVIVAEDLVAYREDLATHRQRVVNQQRANSRPRGYGTIDTNVRTPTCAESGVWVVLVVSLASL